MVIATDYKYMKGTGAPPRFEEAFAFKHILNATDSDTTFLKAKLPLAKDGTRWPNQINLQTNSDRAYAQAMNRFNTTSVSSTAVTLLEVTEDPPRPKAVNLIGGAREYTLDVQRAWRFERVENNFAPPNYTKYEAKLTNQFTTPRVAKMSCMGTQGVVNHWEAADNMALFS